MTVIGSGRAAAGVSATVRRVRDALADVGVAAAEPTGVVDGNPWLIVDPAAWYAAQPAPPSSAKLARAIALSVAPYGTPAMQDDAQVGRLFGAIAHPDARSSEHLARLGCRARHVPLGCGPLRPDVERTLDVLSAGPPTPRRLRVLAGGALELDDLRCAHRFDEGLSSEGEHPAAAARVFLDIADDDDAAPHVAVLLEALEAGAAVATERLGQWPGDLGEALLTAPLETLFARARQLALDPERARALAFAAHAAVADAFPLQAMGGALAELLDETKGSEPAPSAHRPQLSHHAAPHERLGVRERVAREQRSPDAAVREGMRRALADMRRLERRMARLESGEPDVTEVLRAPEGPADPRISVIVPAFEARRMLPAALDSVHVAASADAAPVMEVVVVDDGSPQDDATAAIAWAQAHPQLAVTVLRHRHNRGLAAARNTALEHARGELVIPLDADNALLPSGLQRLLGALDGDPGAAFAYGLLREFDEGGAIGLRGLYPWDPERLRYGNYIDALALMRREALVELGGYALDMPEQGYEDWDVWCRFAENGLRGVWVPQVVANYRIRADSMSAALHLSHIGPLADMLARHPALLG